MASQRRFSLPFFLMFFSLPLITACSGPVTCALEGCAGKDSVTLSDDANASKDADAIPKKQGELEKKIGQILERLGLSEALGLLHSKTLDIHEQRLAALEEKSAYLEGGLKEAQSKITLQANQIQNNELELEYLHHEMHEQIDALAAKQQEDINLVYAEIGVLRSDFESAIEGLDNETKQAFKDVLTAIETERRKRINADKRIAAKAAENLANLRNELMAQIESLEKTDAQQAQKLKALTKEINRVDDKVDAVIVTQTLFALQLYSQLNQLKAEIKRLDKADIANYKKLSEAIQQVSSDLSAAVAKLDAVDEGLLGRVVALEGSLDALRDDHDLLNSRFVAFEESQKKFNKSLVTSGDLKRSTEKLYQRISEEQNAIHSELRDLISSSVTALANSIGDLPQIRDMSMLLSELALAVNDPAGKVEQLKASLMTLTTRHDSEIAAIQASIAALKIVVDSKGKCTIGERKTTGSSNNNSSKIDYQSLICDGVEIQVLVK